jgi:translation initiation factor IF-3
MHRYTNAGSGSTCAVLVSGRRWRRSAAQAPVERQGSEAGSLARGPPDISYARALRILTYEGRGVWCPASLQRAPTGGIAIALARDQRTDRRIKAKEVRVVGPAGEQLGVLSIESALSRAQEAGLNLVEVNPMAKPPVCKIMDYGRFKYEEKKKANDAKKKQVVVKVKEIKLRPKTEEHDYETKVRHAREFIEEGNKAKITIMFRGREITHRELGTAVLDDVVNDLKEIAIIEQPPRMEGKQMFLILSPNPKVAQKARDQQRMAIQAQEKEKLERKANPAPSSPRPGDPAASPQRPPLVAVAAAVELPAPEPAKLSP